jgi:adenylate cyclase, class 2
MAIEVELKATLPDRDRAVAWLGRRATGEPSTYRDTYYDWPDGTMERDGRRELRVRVVDSAGGSRALLTYKAPMLDVAMTPEYETSVADAAAMDAILCGLGLTHVIAYEKRCINFRFRHRGRAITATVVDVPELPADTFLEVETLVRDDDDTGDALAAVRSVLAQLGLGDADLAEELYVDMVRRRRVGA